MLSLTTHLLNRDFEQKNCNIHRDCVIGETPKPSVLDNLGHLPVISTISGLSRALLGTIHAISHLAAAVFNQKNREYHLESASFGASHITRGLIEMVPIAGNLIVRKMDADLVENYKKETRECSECKAEQDRKNEQLSQENEQKFKKKIFCAYAGVIASKQTPVTPNRRRQPLKAEGRLYAALAGVRSY